MNQQQRQQPLPRSTNPIFKTRVQDPNPEIEIAITPIDTDDDDDYDYEEEQQTMEDAPVSPTNLVKEYEEEIEVERAEQQQQPLLSFAELMQLQLESVEE